MIREFKGEYYFLSNFWIEDPVCIDKVVYKTIEHYYQAQKTLSDEEFKFVIAAPSPKIAKQRGRRVVLRKNWDNIKLCVMEKGLRIKFSKPHLLEKLVYTYPLKLIEGNVWGDTYWGVCRGTGHNHLGKLLMKIRGEYIFRNAIIWGFTSAKEDPIRDSDLARKSLNSV